MSILSSKPSARFIRHIWSYDLATKLRKLQLVSTAIFKKTFTLGEDILNDLHELPRDIKENDERRLRDAMKVDQKMIFFSRISTDRIIMYFSYILLLVNIFFQLLVH
mgnify:CR=1 FL=1